LTVSLDLRRSEETAENRPRAAHHSVTIDQGAGLQSRVPALFDDVIDRVQPEKADEDQIDSDSEAHDPRREQQEQSREQGSDGQ